MKVKKALVSVYDKTNILEFVSALQEMGVEIICTEGTAAFLKDKGLYVREVSELTGFPPLLFGRIKTLHPHIFAPILAKRDEESLGELGNLNLEPIDLVCVNLYPFEEIIKKNPPLEEALEMVDIGGVSLLRAGAKNFPFVAVICDPADYQWIISELENNALSLSEETLRALAVKAFRKTALYDLCIWQYLSQKEEEFPPLIYQFPLEKVQILRYGENPHQRSVFYRFLPAFALGELRQLGGRELSFNNILDIDGAMRLAEEFEEPCAVVVKHTSPCGVAVDEDIVSAYIKARDADAESAFGGVVAVNREVNRELAEEVASTFIEVLVAPSFTTEAIELLRNRRKNLRLIRVAMGKRDWWDVKGVKGGVLLQDGDELNYEKEKLKVVTESSPSLDEMEDLLFAWTVCKYVKSNAIVVAKNKVTLGIGGGQPSRVRSAKIALEMAGEKARGAVLASDGFFPFPDSVELAGKYGVRAIIQPGGSVRDEEVIQKANELGIAMLLTTIRHFRH